MSLANPNSNYINNPSLFAHGVPHNNDPYYGNWDKQPPKEKVKKTINTEEEIPVIDGVELDDFVENKIEEYNATFNATLKATISFLPEFKTPVCVTVTNPAGEPDCKIKVVREPLIDTNFEAKGGDPQSSVTTTKLYKASVGENKITVYCNGEILATRTIQYEG